MAGLKSTIDTVQQGGRSFDTRGRSKRTERHRCGSIVANKLQHTFFAKQCKLVSLSWIDCERAETLEFQPPKGVGGDKFEGQAAQGTRGSKGDKSRDGRDLNEPNQ